ncbi:MAG TPA: hypothetical protein VIL79_01590 [Thermoleophilia bacterium]
MSTVGTPEVTVAGEADTVSAGVALGDAEEAGSAEAAAAPAAGTSRALAHMIANAHSRNQDLRIIRPLTSRVDVVSHR